MSQSTDPSQAMPAGAYNAAEAEKRAAGAWIASGAFHAEPDAPGKPYAIVIPPPNVTAALHMGHALNNTLQDILVRWRRMCGDNAMWMPGTDHAGIATQTVVDKRLQAEGRPALKDYKKIEAQGGGGREKFIEKVQAWKDEYEATITAQLKAMGCSCDWDRQRFTMDEVCAKAVREAFFRLFKEGLIYRGKRLVNWDPATQTALADDEVEMREVDGNFYYMKYPLVRDEKSEIRNPKSEIGYITVATTRPETFLGDTAVAVNPKDPLRAQYIGQHVRLPIVGRVVPIIGDDYVVIPDENSTDVKAKYASGFLKVTPAHDPNDYEIGHRHGLPTINVMAPDGTISDKHGWSGVGEAGFLLGKDRFEARKAIVRWFKENNLLEDVKPYRHTVGHSYRSHVPIEPYLSDQWYVKVTDDRLAGAALRAMAEEQYESRDADTSRDRQGAVGETRTYLITWSTYGSRLHGDSRGSVHHGRSQQPATLVPPSPGLERAEQELMRGPSASLGDVERPIVRDTLLEVCAHRGWRALAVNVRTEHVHVVVEAADEPEKVMGAFKAYGTRRLKEAGRVTEGESLWARHGSTRYLNEAKSIEAACDYVLQEQGEDLGGMYRRDADDKSRRPLPDGRGSSRMSGLRFHPPRYAKTFQTWHENIRDWCISRQLWWGHRIPVWSKPGEHPVAKPQAACRLADGMTYVCLGEDDPHLIAELKNDGFTQDPDVLDTWFSSALWPISTLGWPDESEIRNPKSALNQWNPSDTLCTAREIITLWVSRMVMFNLFFRGCLPFRDVFIHAMIQDGEGQKMSKSLGNGVDPLDIIHSHGADAMRFTLAQMTTQTQDVRMPVDVVCPHTGTPFTPKKITVSGGYTVAAPTQECPTDPKKKMVTSYGLASGQAKPTGEMPPARNTSSKFDNGRNFANKIWNAARFVLSKVDSHEAGGLKSPRLELADRWVLSRLARTIETVDAALRDYQFNVYAQSLYDFFWRDYCDWYVEAVKPNPPGSAGDRVLPAVLDASVRLLHPVMPFITEQVWEHVGSAAKDRSLPGLKLPASELCVKAAWPVADASLVDAAAESHFGLMQEVVTAVRNVRNQYAVPPRQGLPVRIKAAGDTLAVLEATRTLIATLACVEIQELGADAAPSAQSAVAILGAIEIYVEGLVDPDAEKKRLDKRMEELNKSAAALKARLDNPGYADRAPAKLVQQTRDQLAEAEKEIETITAKMASL